ncbi:MAG: hypothetical protein OXC91_04445 [Rhodobacteraceae bacterium]|nr:hypothetical protein [Paracoccaceae bacterium]
MIPIYVAMNLSFVIRIPQSLEEAARVATAGLFQVCCKIALVVIKPGPVVVAILAFRMTWNGYLPASPLPDRHTRTVPFLSANTMPGLSIERGPVMATGMLRAIPPIALARFVPRQIMAGTAAAAVKGYAS